jgi:alpha-mannosidase
MKQKEDRHTEMKTMHIVLNSHIDPVWLWPWQSGLDAIINTSRSVCNLLERHSDVLFTSGEAWKYWQIQRIEPSLFARIEAHVKKGQWEIIGGWWVQPDCNQPSGWGLEYGISNGVLERGLDKVERSIHDRVLLEFQRSPKLGIVCPEVYAADADAHRLRLTLLRSPLMAWHAQVSDASPRAMCSDHGEHVFRFRFLSGADLTSNQLEAHAWMMMRPPLVAEWTDGMPW